MLLNNPEVKLQPIDETKLFTTTSYSDGIAGSLHVRQAVNFDGHRVTSIPNVYSGVTAIQTNKGPLTVSFEIEAQSLREAFEKWPIFALSAVQKSIGDMQSQSLRKTIMTPGLKS